MCQEFRWVISLASISGVIQSIVWMGLGLAGALVYLCIIPIAPYEEEEDFFRVTFIKLYFEGPKCIPDGSYLGEFNEEYRSEIDLFTPDRVFGVMIAYVILNSVYFILSVLFYKRRDRPSKRGVALGWSITNLLLCALDAAFGYALIFDVMRIRLYLKDRPNTPPNFGEIPYIPLTLALLATRFIAIWLWNFIIGGIIFLDALCCRNIIKKPPKQPQLPVPPKAPQEPQKPKEESKPRQLSVINGYYSNPVPPFPTYKMSVETTANFNPEKSVPVLGTGEWEWEHAQKDAHRHREPHPRKEMNMINEGYVSDEEEKRSDFEYNLKNFEPGQRKLKIVKPPLGKPVVPVDKMKELEKETRY